MKYASVMKVAAAAALVVGLAGCQNLTPIKTDIANLKSQVAQLQSQESANESAAAKANSTADAASQKADAAQSTANQALALAQSDQSAINATNEKIDRMFKRSISK